MRAAILMSDQPAIHFQIFQGSPLLQSADPRGTITKAPRRTPYKGEEYEKKGTTKMHKAEQNKTFRGHGANLRRGFGGATAALRIADRFALIAR
jgi:hypothetical protein